MNGLEIEVPPFTMRETNRTPEFLAKFALGKIPTFEGADGFCLSESTAIASYIAQSGPKAGQLLGTDAKTQALIAQWTSFSEGEIFFNTNTPVGMVVIKYIPYNEMAFDLNIAGLERDLKYLEGVLQGGKKYIIGDKLTMADLMVTSFLYPAYKYLVDAEMRKGIPNVNAYIQAFAALPEHKKYYGELEMCETRLANKL
ncbi:glutathione S-transferase [Xylaria sp. FL1777]|nr:glutathione S-transferase [Xylaria sp. FL1777]